MNGKQKSLIIAAATIIILLLVVLLYLVSKQSSRSSGYGSGNVIDINLDLPDLGEIPIDSMNDDPGLWEQVPGLLETEEEEE